MPTTVGVLIQGIRGILGFGPRPAGMSLGAGWVDGALVTQPSTSTEGYNPDTGSVTAGKISIEINGRIELRDLLLATASRPITRLAAPIDSIQSNLTFTAPIPGLLSGDRIYLRNETLACINASGGLFSRGSGGSRARAWSAGAYVYRHPPYWRRRYVEVRQYTDTDSVGVVRWRGFLDDAPYTSADSLKIILSCSSPLALDADLKLNRDAPVGSLDGSRVIGLTPPYVLKGSPVSGLPAALQVGASLSVSSGGTAGFDRGTLQRLNSPPPGEEPIQVREVLCVARSLPTVNPLALGGLPYPLHPLSLAAALMFSTESLTNDAARYDVLSSRWTCGFASFLTEESLAQITTLIQETRHLQLDHVVLGWDGDSPLILPRIRELILAFGFAISISSDGGLSFTRAAQPASYGIDLDTYLDPVKDKVEYTQSRGGINDSITASLGGLPFRPSASLNVSVQADLTDYPVEGETQSVNFDSLSYSRASELTNGVLISLAFKRQQGSPGLALRLRGEVNPSIGKLYRLRNIVGLVTPIFRTAQNTNTADLERDDFILQVTYRRWLVKEGCWEVEGRLNSWPLGGLLRLRAPSATISSGGATAILTVSGDYGQLGAVGETFRAGQQVSAWTPDGQRLTSASEITFIDGNLVYLSGAFNVSAPTGSILRLADLSDFTLDPREWTFLGADDLYG